MIPTPSWALAACASVPELRRFCPSLVPLTRTRQWTLSFYAPTRRYPVATFQLQSGVQWGGNQEHVHRPPIFGNTVVLGGGFMRLASRAFPTSRARPVAVRDEMANGLRRQAIPLGRRAWSGIEGELSLTPTIYAAEGTLADLVAFRWHDALGDHAVGLNVWEPLTDAVATLHAVVSTLTQQPAVPRPRTVAPVGGVPMAAAPARLSMICRTRAILRAACPSRAPAGGVHSAYVTVAPNPWDRRSKPPSLLVSAEYAFGRGRPPFVHLELATGRIPIARRYAPQVPISRLKVPKDYTVTQPIPLGERAWTANPGRLVFGDCFGNHLCYRWRQDGRRYQIDLHAWAPVTRTVQVLRAIVRSTPAGHG
jgi:hypothetical protein